MIEFVTNPITSTQKFVHKHPFAIAGVAVAITVIVAQKSTNDRMCELVVDLTNALNTTLDVLDKR